MVRARTPLPLLHFVLGLLTSPFPVNFLHDNTERIPSLSHLTHSLSNFSATDILSGLHRSETCGIRRLSLTPPGAAEISLMKIFKSNFQKSFRNIAEVYLNMYKI
jgi:hypothetical protein